MTTANSALGRQHLVAAGLVAALAAAVFAACGTTAAPVARVTSCGASLMDPPVLATKDGVSAELTAAPATFRIGGRPVYGEAYDGSLVGPTIQVHPGENVGLVLHNKLAVTTNLHFHGMHVSPSGSADNPFISVAPGESYTYHLAVPSDQPQGTFWYHDHGMAMTGGGAMPGMTMPTPSTTWGTDVESQIFAGLTGTIQVGDIRSLLPSDLRNVTAHTLVLKDIQVDKTGHIIQNIGSSSINSNNPTIRLVNGQLDPMLTMCPGETQLWRLANEGADIFYRLHAAGYRFTVIAQDGQPASAIATTHTLLMGPGKRYDVLVTAPTQTGTTQLQTLQYSNGPQGDAYPTVNLMQIHVNGTPVASLRMPTGSMPTAPQNLANAQIAERRTLVLSENSSGTQFMIDGKQFDMSKSIFSTPAKLGTVEEWTIENKASEAHPFHIHTDDFQVMSINGVAQPFTGQQDIIPVPTAVNGIPGRVVIRIRFNDFTGKIMFHCHIAAHEDNGMMSYIEVLPT